MASLVRPILWTLILGVSVMYASAQTLTWYVSPEGKDTWSGLLAAPNAEGTDGPFASLAAAVAASRKQPDQPRQVVIAAGRYYVEKTVSLDPTDSRLTIQGAGQGKTILYGGRPITGWRQDGDHLWTADVPQAKDGTWDFRALVVNDRLCPRARLPQTGRLTHETSFPVRWMSTAGGGWERKPTQQELTTMQYKEGDLGPWLSVRNAEVTVYHMWDESMIGVAGHDPATRTLTFASPSAHPPGAFGVKTYVVWNVREGLTQPGQWYLDRDEGRVVYWPLPDEDMSKALVVAPTVETVIEVNGRRDNPVRDFALKSLTLSTTTTPCKAGGFGASAYRGALQIGTGQNLQVVDVEVTNTAGNAIREYSTKDLVVQGCHLHDLGAGGLRTGGGNGTIEGNHIHHVGLIYPSAVAFSGGGAEKYVIRRNEIHDTPYSGMTAGGTGTLIEENVLYRCMQELHDGAAIYMGGARGAILRRNVVRDIVKHGEGYGVSSYYLDEKCRDCVVENNVSIGVSRPTQNHMTLNCTIQGNVFISDSDMDLSFPRSSGIHFTGNTVQLNGKLNVNDPDAVAEWSGNLIIQSGGIAPAISDSMPVAPRVTRQNPIYTNVIALTKAPSLDGKMEGDEWPSGGINLGELPDQRKARGAPVTAKVCADAESLYIGVAVVAMYPEDRKLGTTWGTDEGVEIAVQGTREGGSPVTYVLRGFTDGSFSSLTLAGASQEEADAFGKLVGYGASVDKTVWRGEWRIPLAALRFVPKDRASVPLNITVYRSEDAQLVQWAGSLGETWDLTSGGRVTFRVAQATDAPRTKPVATAAPLRNPPAADGTIADADWPGSPLSMAEGPDGNLLGGKPCAARVATSGGNLLVSLEVPTAPQSLVRGAEWRTSDGAEVCLRGKLPDGKAVTWVLHGFADGSLEGSTEAGAPQSAAEALARATSFRATITETGWRALWLIPLAAVGIAAGQGEFPFNLGVFRSKTGEWINWVGTQGPTWKVESAGLLRIP
jgi:hypothetical protein